MEGRVTGAEELWRRLGFAGRDCDCEVVGRTVEGCRVESGVSLPITDGLGLNVTAFFGIRGVFSVVVVEVEAMVA